MTARRHDIHKRLVSIKIPIQCWEVGRLVAQVDRSQHPPGHGDEVRGEDHLLPHRLLDLGLVAVFYVGAGWLAADLGRRGQRVNPSLERRSFQYCWNSSGN